MSLIVQKFGGTSVQNTECVIRVANTIIQKYKQGHSVIVVVSAQGHTTDELIEKAKEINPFGSKREMDVLLSAGEQISVALLAMAIEKLGARVVSLLGWQVGFKTDSSFGSAKIEKVNTDRIKKELAQNKIVIVAGFQGISSENDITTLGRGGSDTSAVAIAAAMDADICQIYTDVDGVYTADPHIVPDARKLAAVSYKEMLELASLGAQVLNKRSVEMAQKYQIELEVLSSIKTVPGTIVKEEVKMEDALITGVTCDCDVAMISIFDVEDVPGEVLKIFSGLSERGINVDVILQSPREDNAKDVTFTVARWALKETLEALQGFAKHISHDNTVAKVSIVGAGMEIHSGIATGMFEALYQAGINIQSISTSEIKITVLIHEKDSAKAVKALHDRFFA